MHQPDEQQNESTSTSIKETWSQNQPTILVSDNTLPLSDKEMDFMVRREDRFSYGYIQKSYLDKSKCIVADIRKGVPTNVMCEKISNLDDGENDGEASINT